MKTRSYENLIDDWKKARREAARWKRREYRFRRKLEAARAKRLEQLRRMKATSKVDDGAARLAALLLENSEISAP